MDRTGALVNAGERGIIQGQTTVIQTAAAGDAHEERSFHVLMQDVQRGCDAAVWAIINRYEPHIRRVVRRRVNASLRSKFDTVDFVQMVWQSFFHRPQALKAMNQRELAGFLVKMAIHKVDTENRRRLDSKKYNVRREVPLDGSQCDRQGSCQHNPSQIVMAQDQWEQALGRLPSHYREVVRLRLGGFTQQRIAERLQLNVRTIRRIFQEILAELD